ncbi:hypothetical protein EHS25_007269 [Saitozyma podzolica]|uniref:Cytochrome P450-dit2 n=1 Tax=Saitozyma podzolica TaxID=1890683 RepID=A0A427XN44_9TREE|nr:hypothetical protein EHS25_007269 [Saitozyma podzolica]
MASRKSSPLSPRTGNGARRHLRQSGSSTALRRVPHYHSHSLPVSKHPSSKSHRPSCKGSAVPPGTFSFFLSQICQRLGLLRPGSTLHRWLNMGRPVGYDIHKEMGDVFVTANPYGLTLIVADPKVIAHINSKREQFPKPPNHAEIINIYGRNAINTDGEVWRLHRRMNGHVSSERIQGLVWTEGIKQAKMMMESWHVANITSRGDDSNSMLVPDPLDDFLRLSLHVITGSAYGMPLAWNEDPPCTVSTQLSYRHSLEQVTAHLLPIFMIPHWVLRLAIPGTRWSRAWDAYNAFGGYMKGLVNRTSAKMKSGEIEEETILTVLLDASRVEDELVGRTLTESEVLGNSFVMLIAGHEATADTLLYATLLLAQYPAFQEQVLGEIDRIHEQVKVGGRVQPEYEVDFGEAKWLLALMYETLRLYTPTGATTKLSVIDQPIVFKGTTHLIPKGTRISVNGTGVHFNPEVWGPNPKQFNPYRWLGEEYGKSASTKRSEAPTSPPSPGLEVFKPARGTYLPFSEGARGCPGKKYATVEFVAVLVTILRDHRSLCPAGSSILTFHIPEVWKGSAVPLKQHWHHSVAPVLTAYPVHQLSSHVWRHIDCEKAAEWTPKALSPRGIARAHAKFPTRVGADLQNSSGPCRRLLTLINHQVG